MRQTLNKANTYLLIGGAPKCGTTSLFRYFSDHPDVCPSSRKETYFFAREFDLEKVCKTGETIDDFEAYFLHCQSDSKLRLEATPYTLYAKDAARKITSLMDNAYVLFILREPDKRFVSDYKFLAQRGHPSATGSIQDFLHWQKHVKGSIPSEIDMGCYVRYIKDFMDVLGAERVIITFFEDLISNPVEEMYRLCQKFEINNTFFTTYNFGIHNPTINYKSSTLNQFYIRLEPVIANLRSALMNTPRLHKLFEQAVDFGKYGYRLVNSQKSDNRVGFPPRVLQELVEYYQPYNRMLSEELGYPLPWSST